MTNNPNKITDSHLPDSQPTHWQPWLIDMNALSRYTSLSVRTLRRIDAMRDIPGRVKVGRRVLFQTEVIRDWIRDGMPERQMWETLEEAPRGEQ